MPRYLTYKCVICHRELANKQNLVYHLRTEKKKHKFSPGILAQIDEQIISLKVRVNHVDNGTECPFCNKTFINKYSANRHIVKCSSTGVECDDIIGLPETTNVIEVAEIVGDNEAMEPTKNNEVIDVNEIVQKKVCDLKKPLVPGVPFSIVNNMTTQTVNDMKKVKVLLSEDYMPILLEKLGSRKAVYEYLKSCMYRKQAGDLDIFNKIYLEGRSPNYYPVKCIDRKALRFAYVNKDGLVVEGGDFVFTYISGNIQDCYIQIQNDAIEDHLLRGKTALETTIKSNPYASPPKAIKETVTDHGKDSCVEGSAPQKDDNGEFLFNQHDVGGWQDHLVEYMDGKYKKKLLQGLGDMLCEKVDEYDGPYLNIGLNYQYHPDELEFALPKEGNASNMYGFTKEQQEHLTAMATTTTKVI